MSRHPASETVRPKNMSAPSTRARTTADQVMCRMLGIRDGFRPTASQAQRALQRSIIYSGTRCVLAYLVFPFILPIVGMTAAVAAPVGLVVGAVAGVSIISSLRRFFGSAHRLRWWYTSLSVVMLAFVLVLIIEDLRQIL